MNLNINYVIKERQKDIIILSSDDEAEEPAPRPIKVRKLEGSSKADPIQLIDDDEEADADDFSLDLGSPLLTLASEAFFDLAIETDSASDSFNDVKNDVTSPMSSLSEFKEEDMIIEEEPEEEHVIPDMEPPTQVNTFIPKHMDKLEVLRMIEMYIQSVTDIVSIPNNNIIAEPRPSRRTRQLIHTTTPTTITTMKPYVPNQVWYNSTWEDWAQLDVADILHYPFSKDEIQFISQTVSKQVVRKIKREIDFWQSVSTSLPGRTPLDCRCFWTDYKQQSLQFYMNPIMIRKFKDLRVTSKLHLLSKRRLQGTRCSNAIRKSIWASMSREYTITGGSGDAITLAIFNDRNSGLRIAAGSLCDENIQYNVPGNLRLWDQEKNDCLTLNGHQTTNETTGQSIWRTVTDVKMSRNETFIYSSSHDGSANVWRAKNGRLVSTLNYHSKPINQLAVNYSTNDNVLATCSNDGTATIWYISRNGKSGSGVICELDTDFYSDPHVECIEFGHHLTDNQLFLGINNNDMDHPGYIEAYDTASGKPRMRFDSMKGSVSTLAVSSSGRYIVSGNYNRIDSMSGDKHIHLHDIRRHQVARKFYSGHPDVNVVAISPCERFIASGNADKEKGEVVIFDVRNAKRMLHVLKHDLTLVDQALIAPDSSIGIGGLHWMSDSRTIITGGGDSAVKVWNIEGETRLLKSYPTSNCVTSLNVHEETMTIAAGVAGAQGIVHVWQP